jgi:tetratricopeptide (TPR) repeat protein
MKACAFCGEQIQDQARKCPHCRSFQNPAEEAKPATDVASLVVSWVGTIATVITITGGLVAGVFGYVGLRSISESNALNQKVVERIKTFDEALAAYGVKVAALEKQAAEAQTTFNDEAVAQSYARFQEIFDSVGLDLSYDFPQQIQEMSNIATAAAALSPVLADAQKQIYEMKVVSEAVRKYRDALKGNDEDGFLTIVDMLGGLADDNLSKDRLLSGAYAHLWDRARRTSNGNVATYFAKEKHYALSAMNAAQRFNRKATIAKINYGGTLIDSDNPVDWDEGYKLMLDAKKDVPQMSIVYYNLAEYFVKTNNFDNALSNLGDAKRLGDFATCDDLRQWSNDREFDVLRQSKDPGVQNRIKQLKDIGGASC